jgi:hypothetical protein
MKIETALILLVLTIFPVFFPKASIANNCQSQDNNPAQSSQIIRDQQSGLVFEVASNYQTVIESRRTRHGVFKEIYIIEPTTYCYLQIFPSAGDISKALPNLEGHYVLIKLLSGDINIFLNKLGKEPYQEALINGNKALVGNNVIAIHRPDSHTWAIIYDSSLTNYGDIRDEEVEQFAKNSQILLQQITDSIHWNIP